MRRQKSTFRQSTPRARLRIAIICIRFVQIMSTEKNFLPLLPNEFHRIRASFFSHSPVTSVEGIVLLLREAGVGCSTGECTDILERHTTYNAGTILQWRAAERIAMALKYAAYRNRSGTSGVDEDVQVVFSALDEEGTGQVATDRVRSMLESFELAPACQLPIVPPPDLGRMGRRGTVVQPPPEEMLDVAQFAQRFIQIDPPCDSSSRRAHLSLVDANNVTDANELNECGDSLALTRTNSASAVGGGLAWGASLRQQSSAAFSEGGHSQATGVFDRTAVPPAEPQPTFPAHTITLLLEQRVQEWGRDCPKFLQRRAHTTPRDNSLASGAAASSTPRTVSARLYDTKTSTLPPVTPRKEKIPVVGFCSSSQRFVELKPLSKPSTRVEIPRHQATMYSTPRRSPQPPASTKQYDLRRTDARLIGFGPESY